MEFLQYVDNGYALALGGLFIIYLILRKTKVLDLVGKRKSSSDEVVELLKQTVEKQDAQIKEKDAELKLVREKLEQHYHFKSRGSKWKKEQE